MILQCTQCTCRFLTFWFWFSFRHRFRLKNVNFMVWTLHVFSTRIVSTNVRAWSRCKIAFIFSAADWRNFLGQTQRAHAKKYVFISQVCIVAYNRISEDEKYVYIFETAYPETKLCIMIIICTEILSDWFIEWKWYYCQTYNNNFMPADYINWLTLLAQRPIILWYVRHLQERNTIEWKTS